jgi:hypothetical protein
MCVHAARTTQLIPVIVRGLRNSCEQNSSDHH